jgi:hypothetical protein
VTFPVDPTPAQKVIVVGDRVQRTDEHELVGTVRDGDTEMLCVEYDHEPGVTGWWWRDRFEPLPAELTPEQRAIADGDRVWDRVSRRHYNLIGTVVEAEPEMLLVLWAADQTPAYTWRHNVDPLPPAGTHKPCGGEVAPEDMLNPDPFGGVRCSKCGLVSVGDCE